MDSAEIRTRFLRYFADNGHEIVPSASLLLDDPTLLFVNAGMVPFKPYFLGQAPPPYPRATSAQKVVRTLDIEEVGKTTRHASFFQMAGNFSFGDYFKEKAIPYAWELLTRPVADGGYGFEESRLWVTVYLDDEEAIDIWHKDVGLPLDRIQRRGQVDNYWSMGVPGPCGPCSEIYFDRGPDYGIEGGPIADENRYLEVWNLVFMQFERGAGPAKEDYPILGELPAKNIDTGMGLERMAALLQGVDNIYEIDTTRSILDKASELSGARYGSSQRDDIALRVVADHARTCTFLIGDGVIPGNEGRGYVLRRLMRRVIRNMRILGAEHAVMSDLVDATVRAMAPQYPELNDEVERIRRVAISEESSFDSTLRTGTTLFETAVAEIKSAGKNVLPGEQAFSLHDTYGFPLDLTLEMAAEHGLSVDEEGFRSLMAQQRERAKADAVARKSGFAASTAYREILETGGSTTFIGYDDIESPAQVLGVVVDGESRPVIALGEHGEVILDRTPFYAEAGGQLGDHGTITTTDGARFEVYDVQTPVPGLFIHRGEVRAGEITQGMSVVAQVDVPRRKAISRAHTATHMIHRAFREQLGETATQMGSENAPGRLRFDFPSPEPVSGSILRDVEARVNEILIEDLDVHAQVMSQEQARSMGAMALFGEKYGSDVRVVSVGDWAHELCGGTHAQRSGQLGVVSFLSEGSIGAGIRRVEALVGVDAYRHLAAEHVLVQRLSDLVKAPREEVLERIEKTIASLKDAERELARFKTADLLSGVDALLGEGTQINGVQLWTFQAPEGTGGKELREIAQHAKSRAGKDVAGVYVGSALTDGALSLIVACTPAAVAASVRAGNVMSILTDRLGGRGGGKDDMAQGGGGDPTQIEAAISDVHAMLRER